MVPLHFFSVFQLAFYKRDKMEGGEGVCRIGELFHILDSVKAQLKLFIDLIVSDWSVRVSGEILS